MNKKIILILLMCLMYANVHITYANTLNNFSDIQNHWAKENIDSLVNKNIISGYSDGTFRPDNDITIAEFLKLIIEAGEYTLIRSGDVEWPYFYIETAINKKIIFQEEFVDYNKPATRYEIAKIISRFIDTSDVKENKNIFNDLDDENKNNVLKLVKLKIINGYEDKTYRGLNNVTRAEAATIVCKALNARDELISKRKYDISKSIDLTNYKVENDEKKSSIKTYYEVKENNLLIYDHGRYAQLDGYKINDQNIDVKKVIKIIKALVGEKRYVAVVYNPSKYTTNQLRILYGKNEMNTLCNEYDFSFTYYEDKPYELSKLLGISELSAECYLKIDVIKMWENIDDYENGIYVDEYKNKKLLEALKIEFGGFGDRICEYILEKNIKFVTNVDRNQLHVEQKKFGKYTINFLQKENGVPQFYISK